MSETCPVCDSAVSDSKDISIAVLGLHGHCYRCPRCGDFQIEGFAQAQLKDLLRDDRGRAVLSHWIRTKHESIRRNKSGSESVILTPDLIANIIKQSPSSCAVQADKFILWLGDNSRPGEHVRIYPATHQSVVGAMTPEGFLLVLQHLEKKGLLAGMWPSVSNGETKTSLSFAGWEYYEELRRGRVVGRTAFMAMKYNEHPLEDIVEGVFREAVRQTGFELSILRDNRKAGPIDDKLRVDIRTARFLIADLTHGSQGAYWEAGFAEGLGKPVIYTCERSVFEDSKTKTHFDVNHHLTVLWEVSKPEDAAEELKATIRATLPAEAKLSDD